MTRSFPDLLESLEWNILARKTLIGEPQLNGKWKIPAQSVAVDSYVCLIGIKAPKALPTWWLGGWASQLCLFTPASTTQFVSAVDSGRRPLRLGVLNLFVVPKVLKPWILEVRFPSWHEEIYLEIWRYDGADVDELMQLGNVETTLERIEGKIDAL